MVSTIASEQVLYKGRVDKTKLEVPPDAETGEASASQSPDTTKGEASASQNETEPKFPANPLQEQDAREFLEFGQYNEAGQRLKSCEFCCAKNIEGVTHCKHCGTRIADDPYSIEQQI